MGTEQETLIYIENQDKLDASAAANAFAHKDVRNRAYINTLGAELALKYLASENIDVSDIYNIHSIKKVLEELDISDIMLPNIHIDVRVVFDENVIFIPKSHFQYNIVPDIYLVFYLSKDFSYVKFLGFFEPKLINKNNANNEYYFIEKEKLSSAQDLKKYIDAHKGNTKETLSQEDLVNSERIIIAMADNDISEDDKRYLIKQLTKSAALRDKFIEYENFETLSYKAMTDPNINRKTPEDKNSAALSAPAFDVLESLNSTDSVLDETPVTQDQLPSQIEESENLNNPALETIDATTDEPMEQTAVNTPDNNSTFDIESLIPDTTNEINDTTPNIADLTVQNTVETGENAENEIQNKAEEIDSSLDFINSGLEFVDNMFTENTGETEHELSDNLAFQEKNINEETISLQNINLPEVQENTDYIDSIDNKISFEDIKINIEEPKPIDEPAPVDFAQDALSLDNVDTSNLENQIPMDNYNEETISFDDIDTSSTLEELDFDKNEIENTISFDDIDIQEEKAETPLQKQNDYQEETISFDDINVSADSIDKNSDIDDFMDDVMSFDEDPVVEPEELQAPKFGNNTCNELSATQNEPLDMEEINSDTTPNIDPLNDEINEPDISELAELPQNSAQNQEIESEIQPEIIEDVPQETEKTEGFGKNLLENLSSDNMDDISIESLGIDDTNIPEGADNISSHELLSQIDDILNSSDINGNPQIIENRQPHEDSPKNIDTTDNLIPEIIEQPDIQEENKISDIVTDENDIEKLIKDSNSDNEQISNDEIPDTSIDELLNFEDNSMPLSDNNHKEEEDDDDDKLDVLFNDTDTTSDSELDSLNEEINSIDTDNENFMEDTNSENVPPAAAVYNKTSNKKILIVTAALVTVIAAASAVVLLKPKNNNTSNIVEPMAPQPAETEVAMNQGTQNPLEAPDNVLTTNAPDLNVNNKTPESKTIQKPAPAKELSNITPKPKPKTSSGESSYLNVNRLVWDVTDSLSYSDKMQTYLRTAGKSIKLSLSADLLLATEYAYTNQVKVNIKLSNTGAIQGINIASSSGSTQIDNIVLQSVKDTLSVVKPPSDVIKTPDFNLSLIIYF